MEILLGILAPLLATTTIVQLFTLKSQKEKAKISVKEEEAKVDALNLANMKEALLIKGETMVMVERANKVLMEENQELGKKIREYDYKLGEVERKISGMERVITEEISRRDFAEKNICLNLKCQERMPKSGEFKYNYKLIK